MSEKFEIKSDERGNLVEVFKFPGTGQIFYLTTNNYGYVQDFKQFT